LWLSNVSPLTPSHHSPAMKWPNVGGVPVADVVWVVVGCWVTVMTGVY
jgi:hypothetical protein